MDYRKPMLSKYTLSTILGPGGSSSESECSLIDTPIGVLVADGEQHKLQASCQHSHLSPPLANLITASGYGQLSSWSGSTRWAEFIPGQNPAFGPAQVRELTGIVFEKSTQVTLVITYFLCFELNITPLLA